MSKGCDFFEREASNLVSCHQPLRRDRRFCGVTPSEVLCPVEKSKHVCWFSLFSHLVWLVLSDEQMSKRWPVSLLNDEQMSNWVGVKHLPVVDVPLQLQSF